MASCQRRSILGSKMLISSLFHLHLFSSKRSELKIIHENYRCTFFGRYWRCSKVQKQKNGKYILQKRTRNFQKCIRQNFMDEPCSFLVRNIWTVFITRCRHTTELSWVGKNENNRTSLVHVSRTTRSYFISDWHMDVMLGDYFWELHSSWYVFMLSGHIMTIYMY